MHETLAVPFYIAMFMAPVLLAHRNITRDSIARASQELFTLRRSGKKIAGTLYALPGVEVLETNAAWLPSAESQVASDPVSQDHVPAY